MMLEIFSSAAIPVFKKVARTMLSENQLLLRIEIWNFMQLYGEKKPKPFYINSEFINSERLTPS